MKKIGLIIFGVLVLFSSAYAREEELTITTYYPSPYGSYQQLYVADKLGIGTSAPLEKLEINFGNIRFRNPISGTGWIYDPYQIQFSDRNLNGANWNLFEDSSLGNFAIREGGISAAGTVMVAKTGSGEVGIGTPTPTEKLEVAGNIKLSGVSNPYINFNDGARIILSSADALDFQGITSTNVCVKVAFPLPGVCPANYFISSYLAAASGDMVCCLVD